MAVEQTSYASVTSADFVRQFGRWQDHAASQPIMVTHHGRCRLVVLSTHQYHSLVTPKADAEEAEARIATESHAMEHVVQGFIAFGADMAVTQINRAACAYLKVERTAMLGRTLIDRLPGIEESLGYASLARAAQSGSITTLEMPSFAFEGRWLRFETFPHGAGAACLFHDVTDEIEARRSVDLRTATMAALEAHGDIGRAKLSARATFATVDRIFAGFAEFSPEGLARARLVDILVPRLRVEATQAIEAVLSGGGPQILRTSVLTRSGRERAVRIALAPLRTMNAADGAVAVATLDDETV